MKLILTSPVDNLGNPGDLIEVKDGYGRNFLLPQGKAILATKGAVKQIDGIKRAQDARQIRDEAHANEVKQSIEKLSPITINVKTSEAGKLFGSVTSADIASAIKTAGGPAVAKRNINFTKGHVKSLGNHPVKVSVHGNINANLVVAVTAN